MTRILVVEDEPTYRDMLEFNLSRDGFEVETASDGLAAVEKFGEGIDVVLLDYVTKPYSYRELVARIRAILRRVADAPLREESAELLRVGRIEMDLDAHVVRVAGEPIRMPLREFELLELFMENPDRVLTRGQILDRIWGMAYIGDSKTLDVHVKRIRSKIEVEPANPRALVTVRGLGYKLVSNPEG